MAQTSATAARSTEESACAVREISACEDRRITRSKQALKKAMIELVEERGLESFTINDLCARANLNRGTFYNHFQDKDDLLVQLENEVLRGLEDLKPGFTDLTLAVAWASEKSEKPLPFLVEVFDHLRTDGDFLHAMLGPGGDVSFGPRIRDAVFVRLVASLLHERYRKNPTPFVEYYIAYFASAYMGVIGRWLDSGMKEDSSEMARIAMRLLFIQPGESITLERQK